MFSFFEANFIEKFLWESGFQILAKIEMMRHKNRLLAGILKRYKITFFLAELWFL